jgi:hypothetical protein
MPAVQAFPPVWRLRAIFDALVSCSDRSKELAVQIQMQRVFHRSDFSLTVTEMSLIDRSLYLGAPTRREGG